MDNLRKRPDNVEERTYVARVAFEKRADGEATDSRILEGHAAVFDEFTELFDPRIGMSIREKIDKSAFSNALAENQDVVANFNHDDSQLLGRTNSGTVTLAEDERGLNTRIELPATTLGNDLKILVDRGDISKMSFRFAVREDGEAWKLETEDGVPERTLTDLDLFDVSLVTFPAYDGTDIAVAQRSLNDAKIGEPKMTTKALKESVVSADGSSTNVTVNLSLDAARFAPSAVSVVDEEEEKAEDNPFAEEPEEDEEEETKAEPENEDEEEKAAPEDEDVEEKTGDSDEDEEEKSEGRPHIPGDEDEDHPEIKAEDNPFEEDPEEEDPDAEAKADENEDKEDPEEEEDPTERAKKSLNARLNAANMRIRRSAIKKIKNKHGF